MSQAEGSAHATADAADSAVLEALLGRCAHQDRSAFEALYARVAPMLLAVLLQMLKKRDLAEDVLQDVFVKVWQQAGQFDAIRGRPLAWLIAIARYRAIDVQRGARPTLVLDESQLELEPQFQVPAPADSGGVRSALLRCLELIAPPQRRCLMLAYEQGLTHEEIARALGEPLGTIKSWVRRSLQALRRCLEP
ncbi:MAG TPA: sigma-70 family RNA polymerase sigma factor [Steroidobacteraceae bacterium]|nr:sigma-70 family RNA polymerase sigma factor [Steroidobacteraceae bacterium]